MPVKIYTDDDETNSIDHDIPKYSLCLFPLRSNLREKITNFVSPRSAFESFILLAIVLNSISMGCVDFSYIDENYQPRSDISARNYVIERAEIVFNAIFLLELILKSIAYGFIFGRRSYIWRDNWNKLDFVIVLISILGMTPLIPNLSFMRACRVLRPLRSISKLPGLRKIIGAVVDSLEDLFNVVVLLGFLLVCFSIMGVLFWKGLFHARCRVTPFPVKFPANCRSVKEPCWEPFITDVAIYPDNYRCLPDDNDNNSWTQPTSPWFLKGPQDCFWPIDTTDYRTCGLGGFGMNKCEGTISFENELIYRSCGSNYDAFGNPRFVDSNEPFGYPRMKSGVFNEELNWGFSNYDNFFSAFVTSFQVVSLEGWTQVMYMTNDAWMLVPSIVVYVTLIMVGGYIVLNLVLAVITGSMDNLEEEEESEEIETKEVNIERRSLVQRLSSHASVFISKRNVRIMRFVNNPKFVDFMMLCIVLNTVVLGLDHYQISDDMASILENLNMLFSAIFAVEMTLCIVGIGLKAYLSDPILCFDAFIVVTSLIEIMMTLIDPFGAGSSGLSVLRSFRLFRIFKMAKKWKSLHNLLKTMYATVLEIGNFAILLILFIYIYALTGIQFFSNRMHFDHETGVAIGIGEHGYDDAHIPRSHFDDLLWAATTVFQVLSGENWNSVMYDGWRATSWVSVIYFLSLVIIGVFIVMNLFLAILLKNFEDDSGDDLQVTETQVEKTQHSCHSTSIYGVVDQILPTESSSSLSCFSQIKLASFRIVSNAKFDRVIMFLIVLSSICLALDSPLNNPRSTFALNLKRIDLAFTVIFITEMLMKIIAFGFLRSPNAYLKNAWNCLDFGIVLISILGLLQIGPGNALRALRTARVLRPLRMISRVPQLKLVVDALFMSVPAVANVAVISLLFFLIFAIFAVNFLKGTFYMCDGEQFRSLADEQVSYITNPIAWGGLNISEQQWFDVGAESCEASTWDMTTIPSSRAVCDCLATGEWIEVIPQNFNNVASAMALLFEISTTEGWVDVMYAAVDQRGIDRQPTRDSNVVWVFFFVAFLLVGAFFVLELFVGVIIDNFNKIRDKNGRGLMTPAQREWASTQAFIMSIKPEKRIQKPTGSFRQICYNFVMPNINPRFDQCIMFCIIVSSISLATTEFGDSQNKLDILERINVVLTIIFTTEAAIKIFAFGSCYFNDGWNKFDFLIVIGSIIGIVSSMVWSNIGSLGSIIRLFRIGRLFRIIKSVKSLRILFNTMVTSIPSIANIGSLLFLFFFIYSICGVQLYSTMAFSGEMNENANFRTFGDAMLLLLRFSTGENWNGFMRGMFNNADGCVNQPTLKENTTWCFSQSNYPDCTEINGCGGGASLYLYFYSFTLLVVFVILNLFVGVVLEAFENSAEGEILSPDDLESFTTVWAEYDPYATWYVSTDDLKKLINEIPPPLGFMTKDNPTDADLENAMRNEGLCDIPICDNGNVNIVHVATHLARRLAKKKQGDQFNDLDIDHPLQKRIKFSANGTKTLRDVYSLKRSRRKLVALRAFVKQAAKINEVNPYVKETSLGTNEQLEASGKLTDRNIAKTSPKLDVDDNSINYPRGVLTNPVTTESHPVVKEDKIPKDLFDANSTGIIVNCKTKVLGGGFDEGFVCNELDCESDRGSTIGSYSAVI